MQPETRLPSTTWDLSGELFAVIDSLSALRELTAMDVSEPGELRLLDHALDILIQHPELERCSIFLLDDEGLDCAAGRGKDDLDEAGQRRETLSFRLGEGLVGMAAHSGILHHCPDCSTDTRYKSGEGARPHGSLICAPMISRDEVIGVVNAYHPEPGRFHAWHEAVLGLFACAVGHIVDNNRSLRRMPGASSDAA